MMSSLLILMHLPQWIKPRATATKQWSLESFCVFVWTTSALTLSKAKWKLTGNSFVVGLFVLAESCWGQGRSRRSTQDLAGTRTVAGSGRLSTESQVSTGSHRIENVHKPPVLEDVTEAPGSKLSRLSDWPVSLVTEIYTCNFQATRNKKEKKRRHSLSRIKTGHGNKNM